MATRPVASRTDKSPGQMFALVIGVVYLLVGIVGFFVASSFLEGSEDDQLIIFHLNHLHNIVHVVLGVGWIWASRTWATAKQINTIYGVVLLLVALLGFILPDMMQDLLNIRGAGDPDNFLHLVTGALSLYFGMTDRDAVRTTTTTTAP